MDKNFLMGMLGAVALSVVPASANTAYDFNFLGSGTGSSSNSAFTNTGGDTMGNSYQFGVTGYTTVISSPITATVTAVSTDTAGHINTASTSPIVAGDVGQYPGNGLGECNAYEGVGCGSPTHQVDNYQGYDFILVHFSSAVNLADITLYTYQGTGTSSTDNQDFSFYTSNSASDPLTLGTTTISGLASAFTGPDGTVSCATDDPGNCTTGDINTYTAAQMGSSVSTASVTWLLIGAAYPAGSTPDYFKIQEIDTLAAPGKTPEPATFALFGLALTGLGLYGRKRKSNN